MCQNFDRCDISPSAARHRDLLYYDSFEIELSIEKQTYRFRLLKTFRSIHNVFHVSLLKFHRRNFEKQSLSVLMKEKEQ